MYLSNVQRITAFFSSAGTLVISFIGMQSQEVKIKSHVKVVLKSDAEVLDEVVVTAAGIKRSEKSLGYAVSQVSADDVIVAGEPDMLKALQGKVAGVDIRSSQGGPGSATKINIRGASSFFGDNEPLIIVDGVPLSNQQITSSNIKYIDNQLVTVIKIQMICKCKYKTI